MTLSGCYDVLEEKESETGKEKTYAEKVQMMMSDWAERFEGHIRVAREEGKGAYSLKGRDLIRDNLKLEVMNRYKDVMYGAQGRQATQEVDVYIPVEALSPMGESAREFRRAFYAGWVEAAKKDGFTSAAYCVSATGLDSIYIALCTAERE